MIYIKSIFFTIFLLLSLLTSSCSPNRYNAKKAIHSGIPWFDNGGNVISAHGAGLIKENNKFYLFGEYKSDSSNAFTGFSCYSSKDLYNWNFEKLVLPVQNDGILGNRRIGERPKVLKCPETGDFVMYMHTDDLKYKDQAVGYATSKTISGEYTFQGKLLFNGSPIKKWDMGVFQDDDGTGYIITHSGNLYKLSSDYKSIVEQVLKNMTPKCESPIIFKKNGIYFWMGSDLTSWERNDNYYFTATSLKGPWKPQGNFAPENSLTWNSQCSFVLPINGSKDTTYLYMGDRWAFPIQKSAATYVWQPLSISKESIYIPEYYQSWKVDLKTGKWTQNELEGKVIENSNSKIIKYSEGWQSASKNFSETFCNIKGASFSIDFKGSRIGIYGISRKNGGYANIKIKNSDQEVIFSNTIEMYSKYAESSLKYLSPILPKNTYTLTLEVLGDHGNWFTKDGTRFGSSDNFISIDKAIIIN